MKRTICLLICFVMLMSCLQFSSLALSEEQLPDHTVVDYSRGLELGKTEALPLDNDSPLIRVEFCSWRGYAQGFTTELEAGKYYTFKVTLTDLNDSCAYMDRAVAVLRDDLLGDFEFDTIAYKTENNWITGTEILTAEVSFIAPTSGEYKLLAWGNVEDHDANNLFDPEKVNIEYSVYEQDCAVINVETASDLARFSKALNDYEYDGEYMLVLNLKNDIDMTGVSYEPLDLYNQFFFAVYGNGNTLSGMTQPLVGDARDIYVYDLEYEACINFNGDFESRYNVGMIACCAESLYIENSSLNGTMSFSNYLDVEDVGGIVGEVGDFSAYNVVANIDLGFYYVENVGYVGGIVGYSFDDVNISSVAWNGTITVNANKSAYDVAGFIGLLEGDFSFIEHSSTAGEIIFAEPSSFDSDTISGFIGASWADSLYDDCVSCVDVDALGATYVGGFIARSSANASFFNCCYEGVLIGGNITGGFAGLSSASEPEKALFANCYAVADIYAGEEVGGFIGNAYGGESFINCYANSRYTDMRSEDNIPYGIGSFLGVAYDTLYFANAFARGSIASAAYGDYSADLEAEDATFVTVIDFKNRESVDAMTDALNALADEINSFYLYSNTLYTWYPRMNNGPCFVPAPEYTLGDVNVDGAINQYDYILVKRHYFGTRILTDAEMLPADVNNDTKVDQYDYILICRHYFGTYKIG